MFQKMHRTKYKIEKYYERKQKIGIFRKSYQYSIFLTIVLSVKFIWLILTQLAMIPKMPDIFPIYRQHC